MIRTLARYLYHHKKLYETHKDLLGVQVALDGNDLKSLNVGWLRDNIGIVGQEPGQYCFNLTPCENQMLPLADSLS